MSTPEQQSSFREHGQDCPHCGDVVLTVEPDPRSLTKFHPFLQCDRCAAKWFADGTSAQPHPRNEWRNTGARTGRRP